MIHKTIAIVGGGAAALMLGCILDTNHYNVTIYEQNNTLGRKFLVAGAGGLNITHSEDFENFISRYSPADFFYPIIQSFTNKHLREWLQQLGIDTYVGSSKRVFPVKPIKPAQVLTAILSAIQQNQVNIQTNYHWLGWNKRNELIFETKTEKHKPVKADITIFALGGGSWKITGSNGSWLPHFEAMGIKTAPFAPANCAFKINWSADFLKSAAGKSLKNIALCCGNASKKGEVVITQFGMEGGAIYALSNEIMHELATGGKATLYIDLKPALTLGHIKTKLTNRGNKSISRHLQETFNLTELQIALLKFALTKEEFVNMAHDAAVLKKLPLVITAAAPVDEAISTTGGIELTEIDQHFQLTKIPNTYVVGEMLDWNAPTGGYLLQACFSMGYVLARHLNDACINSKI